MNTDNCNYSVVDKLYKYRYPQDVLTVLTSKIEPRVLEVDVRKSCYEVLAEDIYSPVNRPWADLSHVDGYAVIADDLKGASSHNPIKLKIVKNIDPRNAHLYTLKPGETVFVETGYPLPKNSNAVIPVESVRVTGDHMYVYHEIKENTNIITMASDFKKGELVVKKGTLVTPGLQKILIDLGIKRVKVYEKPRVALIAVGSEIVDEVVAPTTRKIPNSSSYLVKNVLEYYGAIVVEDLIVCDDQIEIINLVEKLVNKDIDLILTIGGVSLGPKDFTWSSLYNHFKPEIYFRGLRIHPGRSTSGMVINDKIIVNLPGLPQSTIAALIFIVIPLINYYRGLGAKIRLPYITLRNKEDVKIKRFYGFYRLRYVIIEQDKKQGKILSSIESYNISQLIRCQGFTIIYPNVHEIKRNVEIKVYFLPPLFEYPIYDVIP